MGSKKRFFNVISGNKKVGTIVYDPSLKFPKSDYVQQAFYFRTKYKEIEFIEIKGDE